MNLLRVGNTVINLDHVVRVALQSDATSDGDGVEITFSDGRSSVFKDDEAESLRRWFTLKSPRPDDIDPEIA